MTECVVLQKEKEWKEETELWVGGRLHAYVYER